MQTLALLTISTHSDLVPQRDVALWRSYVNLALTLGRSLGGPIGGWMADTVGWRWYVENPKPVLLPGTHLTIQQGYFWAKYHS